MRYFVFRNGINEWSIRKSLLKINEDINLEATSKGLLKESRLEPKPGDTLFFTEEDSLLKYIDRTEFHFYPKAIDKTLLDNKLRQAEIVESLGIEPIPYEAHEGTPKYYPIYLKSIHSWRDGRKLPRGFICSCDQDYKDALIKIKKLGLTEKHFFYQKLLKSPLDHNISVSGFFDSSNPRRNLLIVTRKVLGNTGKISTGEIVETIQDPSSLIDKTTTILKKINYTGPFEMEFYYEEQDRRYYFLELNPRFWMQHGIFSDFFDNGLMKRYLDIDQEEDWFSYPYRHIVWRSSIGFFHTLSKINITGVMTYFIGGVHKRWYPTLFEGLVYFIKLILKKIFKSLRRGR